MIVEYFGVPGSGKTYHTNLYKEQLKYGGKKYIDISRYSAMPLWLKLLYKLADYTILILPKYRKEITEYKEVCKSCRRESTFVPFSLDYCIKDIVLYSLVYDVFRHFGRIVVNDEGQLHRVIFLVVQFNCSLEEALGIYKSHKHNETVRYIKTPSELAFRNIKKRNRKICPMDEMDDNFLMDYIKTFEKVCEEVICIDFNKIEVI